LGGSAFLVAIAQKVQAGTRKENNLNGESQMKNRFLKLSVMLQVLKEENGQDLIEYALVVALIAFAATAGMGTLANDINTAFTNIGTRVTNYIT